MFNELSCWEVNWNAIGAVATAGGTLVALGVVVIPAWIARRKAQALARALFGVDVLNVLVVAKELSAPGSLAKFKAGHLPGERQLRALSLPNSKQHIATFGFATTLAEEFAKLISHCEELRWLVGNLKDPSIDYERGTCQDVERNQAVNWTLVLNQALTVRGLAADVHAQLYGYSVVE